MWPILIRRLLAGLLLSLTGTLAQAMDADTCTNLVTVEHPGTRVTHAELVATGQFAPEEPGFADRDGLDELQAFCRLMGDVTPGYFRFEFWIPLDGWTGQQVIQHGCCSEQLLSRFSQGAALVTTFTADGEGAMRDRADRQMREIMGLLARVRSALESPQ
jgi:hypothetical protein